MEAVLETQGLVHFMSANCSTATGGQMAERLGNQKVAGSIPDRANVPVLTVSRSG